MDFVDKMHRDPCPTILDRDFVCKYLIDWKIEKDAIIPLYFHEYLLFLNNQLVINFRNEFKHNDHVESNSK